MKHRLKITQVVRVTREIIIEHEAEDLEDAIEAFATGEEEAPAYSDPRWVEYMDLLDEKVESTTEELSSAT